MIVYTAESIIKELLKHKKELSCEEVEHINGLGCPQKQKASCDPENCDIGERRECAQRLSVILRRKGMRSLYALCFNYRISQDDADGFIRETDYSIKILIRDKHVNQNALVKIEI